MASTFAFAQDISDPQPDSTPTSIDGDAMAPNQSSKSEAGPCNEPGEDPQSGSEAPEGRSGQVGVYEGESYVYPDPSLCGAWGK